MIGSEYNLELCNIFHSGQIEPESCMHRIFGNAKTGIILKDVSFSIHSGEVLAILGSKGSGKKALLDVISGKAKGSTRGQVYLNGQPMSLSLFQERCGYVTHKFEVIPGLTVEQTLYYTPTRLTGYLKKSKVKQVMADLALSQVANRCVENLSKSEYRRLTIGLQLMKDPVILLLDEPTRDLDPLNTYLVVSILSNEAKKYGVAIILTMEKPRSDVFPFLDKVLYLCLGNVIYSGGTREMLEYFDAIGFPCPQLENPLMYYLCLSTVDRRSRDRFLESNHQIVALVEKFRLEGGEYRKTTPTGPNQGAEHKIPLLYDKMDSLTTTWTIYTRLLLAALSFQKASVKHIFLRLLLLPMYFFLLWLFYNNMEKYQHTFVTKSGLIFNCLAGTYFLSIVTTTILFPVYRTKYFQESQEGLYGGTLFLLTYDLVSIPFSVISVFAGSAIIFSLIGSYQEPLEYLYFSLLLCACYIFSEQLTIAILTILKDNLLAAIFSIYISCICLTLGSGILRSYKGLQDIMYRLMYGTQVKYAASFLNRQVFLSPEFHNILSFDRQQNCTKINSLESSLLNGGVANPYCRYGNGQSFLFERYARENSENIFGESLDFNLNIGIVFAFVWGMILLNLCLYLIPLPGFIKAKFRV